MEYTDRALQSCESRGLTLSLPDADGLGPLIEAHRRKLT
jgi:hypothetical protein